MNNAPIANPDNPIITENIAAHIDVQANDSDPDGDPLTTSILVQPSSGGTAAVVSGDSVLYTPLTGFSGTDTIVYQVCDNGIPSLCDSDTIFVVVDPVNDAPTLDLDANNSTTSGNDYLGAFTEDGGAIQLVDSDVDVDDVDNANLTGAFAILTNPIDGADESLSYVGSDPGVSINASGDTVVISGTYSHAALEAILLDLRYNNLSNTPSTTNRLIQFAVTDGALSSDTALATISITPNNDSPIATDDNPTLAEDSPLTNYFVAGNDSDPEGALDNASVTILTGPSNGTSTAVVDGVGGINYTPGADFNGNDTIEYRICDAGGLCDTALLIVNVTAVDDNPVANTDNETIAEDAALTNFNVSANDTDVDGDLNPASVGILSGPSNGTATVDGVGGINYTPNTNFNGIDTIIYRICDGQPACDSDTLFVTVTSVDDDPVANTDNETILEDAALTNFNVSANDTDNDGDLNPASVSIVSGPSNGTATADGAGGINYTPDANFNGVDTIIYQICDGQPVCDSDTLFVTVTAVDDNPVANTDNETISEDAALTNFNVSSNDSDPDGDLDLSSISILSGPSNGTSTAVADGAGGINYTPGANFNGIDTIIYQICDGQPICVSDTLFVTVTSANDNPVANSDNETILEDASLTNFDVSDNDSDADGDLDPSSVSIISGPSNGTSTAVVDGVGGINYTPGANFNGVDTIIYQICDGQPACDTDTLFVTVTPVDDNPVANTDNETIAEDAALTNFNVSANDTDVDGDLDLASINILSGPSNGSSTATADGAGGIDYTPGLNFNGVDTIIYEICDGQPVCDSDTLFVTVTPVNDDPVANTDNVSIDQGQVKVVNVITNDSDGDDDLDVSSVTILSGPTTGATATVDALGNVTFDYSAIPTFTGSDTVIYQVCDGQPVCDSDTVFITINAGNSPITNTDNESLNEDDPLTIFNVASNDSDPDGNLNTGSVSVVSGPTGTGSTVTVNANGTLNYTAGSDFNGIDTIIYSICDSTLLCSQDTLFVTVAAIDDNPVANTDNETINEDDPLTNFNVSANDVDVDGDLDLASVTILSGPTNGTSTATADGAGGIDYTPGLNFNGVDTIIYQICDGQPVCDSDTLFVTVNAVADNPIANTDNISIDQGQSDTINVTTNDIDVDGDLDVSSVTILSGPSSGAVANVNALGVISLDFSGVPTFTGADTIIYQVCDGQPACDSDTLFVMVSSGNAPITTTDNETINEDAATTIFDVAFNDSDPDGNLNAASVSIVSGPTGAGSTATLNANGTINFTPGANFNGIDTLIYSICDSTLLCSQDTLFVTVTPIDDDPVANADNETIAEDAALTNFNVSANDDDVDGDLDLASITILSGPSNGTSTATADGAGGIDYTPGLNFNGVDTIIYQICDGQPVCVSDTLFVTVTPVDDDPIANSDNVNFDQGQSGIVNVAANDSDGDDDLDISSVSIVSGPTAGATTSVDALGNVTFDYSGAPTFSGIDTVIYQICDARPICTQDTIFVTVDAGNGPITVADTATVDEDDPTTIINVAANDSDPDGNLNPASVTLVSGPTGAGSTVTVNANGTLNYTPGADFNGFDTIVYQICDSTLICATETLVVTVNSINDFPIANDDAAAADPGVEKNIFVEFNDSDADGDALALTIIGGPNDGTAIVDGDSIKYTASPSFLSGLDTIIYTACDSSGACDTAIVIISVPDADLAPFASNDNATVSEDGLVYVRVLDNDIEPNGDGMVITNIINGPSDGTATIVNDSIQYEPDADFNGTDTLYYVVCDNTVPIGCDTARVVMTISPVADNPNAVGDLLTIGQGAKDTSDVAANDSDVDGDLDPTTVTVLSGPLAGGATAVGTTSGTVVVDYSGAPSFVGADTIVYRICDLGGLCDTDTLFVTVTPGNNPVTTTDMFTVDEDDPTTNLNVTANDSDPDGNLDSTSVTILSGPSNGTSTAIVLANGTIDYTPGLDFFGTDTIVYQICDATNLCSSDTLFVTVSPVADDPVTVNDTATVVEDGGVTSIDVAANDSDPDGDLNLASVSVIAGPTATGSTAIPNGAGGIDYTPGNNFAGTDTIIYQICDSRPACAQDTLIVTVTPVSDIPVTSGDTLIIDEDDATTNINVAANDSDPDGDLDVSSVTIITGPTGTNSAGVDGVGGINFTPGADFNGTDTIVYEICDATPSCVRDTLIITVNPQPDAPDAVNDVLAVDQGQSDSENVADNDSDVDGDLDVSTVTVVSGPTAGATTSVDALGNVTVDYNGAPTFTGFDTIEYRICDLSGLCDTAELVVNVSAGNGPVTTTDLVTIDEDDPTTTFNVAANDSDPDGNLDTTSVTIVSGPTGTGSTVNVNADGTIDYTPGSNFFGTDTIVYQICDFTSICSQDTLFVGVNSINDFPVALDDIATVPAGGEVNIHIGINDSDADGDVLTYSIIGAPSNGTAFVDGDSIKYTADPFFISGIDTITYVACDPLLACDTAYAFVTTPFTAFPPNATDDAASLNEDDSTYITVLSNDSDPNNDPLTISAVINGPSNGTATIVNDSILYVPNAHFNGMDTLSYIVCDTTSPTPLCDTAQVVITITSVPDAPIAVADSANFDQGGTLFVDVSANDSDADGNLDLGSVTILSGPNASGATALTNGSGGVDLDYSGAPGFNGLDTIVYQICDLGGLCDSDTIFVSVGAGSAPITASDFVTINEDTSGAVINVIFNDSDADGNLNPASVSVLSGPSNGTATPDGTGKITYVPTGDFNGIDTIIYQVCDFTLLCAIDTVIITVNPVDDNPIAIGDVLTIDEDDSTQTVNVLANDSDVDGDLDTTSVTITFGPSSGTATVVVNPNGTIDYTVGANFTGTDTIVYQVCDGQPVCVSDTLFVTVNPIADDPITQSDTHVVDEDDSTSNILVLANDSDPDNDLDPLTVSVISGPSNGTSTAVDLPDGSIDYTPGADFFGTDTIIYQVCDGRPVCVQDTVFVTVNPIDDDPFANSDNTTAQQGTSGSFDVSTNDGDVDGNLDPTSVTIISGPTFGATASVDGLGGIDFDYSGASTFTGLDIIVYQICDLTARCTTDTLFVNVTTGNAPITVADNETINEDDPTTIFNVAANDSDPDGNLDSTSVTIVGGPTGAGSTLTVNPDGTINYTPGGDFNGTDTIVYQVCDATFLCSTDTLFVSVTPVNDNPIANNDAAATDPGVEVNVHVAFNDSDVDGDLLDFTIIGGPSNGIASVDGDSIKYTPNVIFLMGMDTITYTACDPSGACDTALVIISVPDSELPPNATDDLATLNEDGSVNILVLANDSDPNGGALTLTGFTNGPSNGTVTISGDSLIYTPNPDFNGKDTVSYIVCDDTAPTPLCDTAQVVITITAQPDAPIAVADAIATGQGTTVNANVAGNDTDVDGDLDSTSVAIISGPNAFGATALVDGVGGINLDYTGAPAFVGVDTLVYQICDLGGLCDTDTLLISVNSGNPPVTTADPITIDEDSANVVINVTANDFDPDGNLDPTAVTVVFGPTVTGSSVVVEANGELTYNPGQDFNGTDTIVYQVCDETFLCSLDTVFITVNPVDDAPIANRDNGVIAQGGSSTINVAANDTDVDGNLDSTTVVQIGSSTSGATVTTDGFGGLTMDYSGVPTFTGIDTIVYQVCDATALCDSDTLFVSVTNGSGPITTSDVATIDEDDPTTTINVIGNDVDPDGNLDSTSVTIVGGPTSGATVVVNPDGTIDYTPIADFNGTDTIVYQVCDLTLICATDTLIVTVTPVDDNPITTGDFLVIDEDATTQIIDVLSNDSDADNDLDTASLNIISTTVVANGGTLSVNPDGTITYDVGADFNGVDTIIYEICDAQPVCAQDTVIITVNSVNDNPMITDGGGTPVDTLAESTPEDTPILISLNVIDVDGDPLDVVAVAGGPSNGTITGLGDGDTSFTYTPDAGFSGIDTVLIVVCDQGAPVACDTVTIVINVTPVNDSPIANDDIATTDPGVAVISKVLANDSDPDGDVLGIAIIGGPSNGVATVLNGDSITYTPDITFVNGIDTIVYIACDLGGLCDTAKLVVFVPDQALPPFLTDDVATLDEDNNVTINVLGNDFDPNGDSIYISSVINGPASGSVSIINGKIVYTPNGDFNGSDSFQYIACDTSATFSQCDTALVTITVDPVNDNPVITGGPIVAITEENVPVEICLSASDVDGDALDVTGVKVAPNHGTITGLATGDTCFTYIPDTGFSGTDSLKVVICDPFGACDTVTVVITVDPANDNPIITDGSGTPVDTITSLTNEDTPIKIIVNAIDPNGDNVDVVTIISGPNNGTVTGLADGDTALVYTPNDDFNGNDTVVAVVCDDGVPSLCDTVTIVITVDPVNDNPVITDGTDPVDEITSTTTAGTPVTICLNGFDVDGDIIDVTAAINGPMNGGVSGVNDGDTCFTYTPDVGFTGNDTTSVIVCDPSGGCDTVKVVITVVPVGNNDPIAVGPINETTPEDTPITIKVTGTDPDGDPVDVMQVVGGPSNGTITGLGSGDTSFTYTPDPDFFGTDTVYVTFCDVFGACDTVEVVITVTPTSDAPIITDSNGNSIDSLVKVTLVDTPIDIRLDVIDLDGDAVDLTNVINGPSNGTISGLNTGDTTFTYTPNLGFVGFDTVTAVVCENSTLVLCDEVHVVIIVSPLGNNPPFVTNNGIPVDTLNVSTIEDSAVVIRIDATDPDGDPVDVTGIIRGPSNGTITGIGTGDTTITYIPDPNFSGTDTVEIVVCDQFLSCDTTMIIITVDPVNENPFIVDNNGDPIDSLSVVTSENTPIEICLTAIDPDGDFVDATAIGCGPNNGTVTGLSSGNLCVTYTPDNGFTGEDTICIVVCDVTGLCDTLITTISVIPTNNSPVVTDTVIVSTTSGTPVEICVAATDVDGDDIQLSNLISGPSNGSVGNLGDGDSCFTYIPDNGFEGIDTLFVLVCDDGTPTACDTAIVVVTVGPSIVNNNPVITEGDTVFTSTLEDMSTLIALTVTDADGDTVDLVTIISGPNNGNVNGLGDGDTALVYTPIDDFNGLDTIVAVVCDNGSPVGCDTVTIIIDVIPVNDDPIVINENGDPTDVVTSTTTQGDPVTICLDATDIDGDVLDVTAAISGPSNGGVSEVSDGDTCFTYTPDSDFTGLDTVTVVVCDPAGACDTVNVIITVVPDGNNDPDANEPIDTVTTEDTAILIVLTGTDPDGDSVDVVSVVGGPSNGTITGIGTGDTSFTYIPNDNFNGIDTVLVTFCDVFGACDTVQVTITVTPVNDDPIIVDADSNSVDELIKITLQDTPIEVKLNVIDVDGDSLDLVSIIGGPSNGTITNVGTGDTTFTYTPNGGYVGNDTVQAIVCDNGSPVLCDTVQVVLVVTPVGNNNAVITAGDTIRETTNEDVAIDVHVDATDIDGDNVDVITVINGPSNGTVTGLADGDTTFTYNPNQDFNGLDTMTVVVCDVFFACDTTVAIITVNPINDDPIIVNTNGDPIDSSSVVVTAGDSIQICLDAIDPDGDIVDVTAVACGPNEGTISGLGNGDLCLTYTSDSTATAADTICVVVCDVKGACDTLVITVTTIPVNTPPDVTDTVTVSTNINTEIEVCIPVTDADGNAIELTALIGGPNNGSVGNLADGDTCFTYIPDSLFTGIDTISVLVCDDGIPTACDTGIVIVTVTNPDVNTPPDVTDTVSTSTVVNTPVEVCLTVTDANGDTVNLSSVVNGPSNGTISDLSDSDTCFTYTPDSTFTGVDTMFVVVCDNGSPSACDTAIIIVTVIDTVVNTDPVVTDSVSVTTTVNTPVEVCLTVTDANGDTVSLSSVVNGPSNGTISDLNDSDTCFTYTPDSSFTGVDTMLIVVCDNGSPVGCDTSVVIITVTGPINQDPIAMNDTVVDVLSEVTRLIVVQNNDSDPDGDLLTTTIIAGPFNGTATVVDTNVSYTSNTGFIGQDSLQYVVCDPSNACDTAWVLITVLDPNTNLIPDLTDDVAVTAEDTAVAILVLNNDSDPNPGDTLTITSIAVNPTNGTVVISGDTIVYTPNLDFFGLDTFTYVACDNGTPVLCDTAQVVVTVTPVNDDPVVVDDTVSTTVDVSVDISVLDNDSDVDDSTLTVTSNDPNVVINGGVVTYTPDIGFVGIDTVIYTVCDSSAVCVDGLIIITVIGVDEFVVHNGVSPNGDGDNDVMIIDGIENYPENVVQIFNRWGNLVFEVQGYDNNDPEKSWGGIANQGVLVGNNLPAGTYFFIVELNDEEKTAKTGFVVLSREN